MRRLRIAGATLAAVCALGAPAVAGPAPHRDVVTLAALGYDEDPVPQGPHPSFRFEVPLTPRLLGVAIDLVVHPSPLLDPRSSVVVRIDDAIARRTTVGELRRHAVLHLEPPLPHQRRRLQVELTATLFASSDACRDVRRNELWLDVERASQIVLRVRPGDRPFIAQYLDPYGAGVNVVAPHGSRPELLGWAVPLAYWLHRVDAWRDRAVRLTDRADPELQNVILDETAPNDRIAGENLVLATRNLALTRSELEALFPDPTPEPLDADGSHVAHLDDLLRDRSPLAEIGRSTRFGSVDLARYHGIPRDALLRLDVAHDALARGAAPTVNVTLNDHLVAEHALASGKQLESLRIPLDTSLLRARNLIAVGTSYLPRRADACATGRRTPAVDIASSPELRWRDQRPIPLALGDFLAGAAGRLAVIVADPGLLREAFSAVDALGRTNGAIRRIDVHVGDWHLPAGYDAALVIVPPELLGRTAAHFRHNDVTGSLRGLADPASIARVASATQYVSLQTAVVRGTPTLFVSYTGAPDAIEALRGISAQQLLEQHGDLFLADAGGAIFATVAAPPVPEESYAEHLRRAALPVLLAFSLLVGLVVAVATNRTEPS